MQFYRKCINKYTEKTSSEVFFVCHNLKEVRTVAQRGRKPKPTAVKVLEGNPGKRSLNTGEPKPEKKAPRCPSWLEEEAKEEWKRMAKQL